MDKLYLLREIFKRCLHKHTIVKSKEGKKKEGKAHAGSWNSRNPEMMDCYSQIKLLCIIELSVYYRTRWNCVLELKKGSTFSDLLGVLMFGHHLNITQEIKRHIWVTQHRISNVQLRSQSTRLSHMQIRYVCKRMQIFQLESETNKRTKTCTGWNKNTKIKYLNWAKEARFKLKRMKKCTLKTFLYLLAQFSQA